MPLHLLDVGCGSGAFTIGAALRKFDALGLSWDKPDTDKAINRAALSGADKASFQICDVRYLDREKELVESFDYVLCTENIEHIINDQKLMDDMTRCLNPGGKLLLTTPNFDFKPMYGDTKFVTMPEVEHGWHVRVGYTPQDLKRLCGQSGLSVDEISYCGGFFSQKITSLQRFIAAKTNLRVAWLLTLPMRVLPILADRFIPYTGYSICLVATKK
jgi:cyclopropane fatty-acyl-phospholipid synthase-like methyltransferase